jgi:hypothetical protein
MRPVCPSFPAVLAPCLLGCRMLGPRRLVQFGPIGLDQSIWPIWRQLRSATAVDRDPGQPGHLRSTGGTCQVCDMRSHVRSEDVVGDQLVLVT